MNAKRLLLYLEELGMDIRYGIDQNHVRIHFRAVYGMDMELPEVDSVCITIRDWTQGLQKELQEKLPGAYVWALAELDDIFR